VRMVVDGFSHPNGIAFSPDGAVCYITDTSHIHGSGHLDPSLASTM
jgi:gluconolactonase